MMKYSSQFLVFSGMFALSFFMASCLGAENDAARTMLQSQIESAKSEINLAEAAQSPEIGALWGQLGMLYQAHDIRYHDGGTLQPLALEAFRKAISLSDDNTVLYQVHQRLGMLLKMMSRGEEAVVEHTIAYELAVSAEEKADALQQHAAALGMIGDLKGSIELLEKSLRIYPKGLAAYLPLVAAQKELKQWSPREWSRIVEDMTAAIKSASDSKYKHNKIKVPGEIYWAMFQALELLGRFEDAWGYLDIAHKVSLESREKVSSLRQMDDQLQQVVTVFQKSMFPEPPLGSASKTPVFIVGMMRSGSTLLETMLDSHPQIYGMGEDSFFNSGLGKFRDDLVDVLKIEDATATENALKSYGKTIVDKMLKQATSDPNKFNRSNGNAKPRRVVDKMLFNYRNIGFIHLIFPNAVILHTVRDPMDTLLSCYRHKFDDSGLDWAMDMQLLSRQFINYLKNMYHFKKVLPGRVYDVNYQALVTSTEKTIRDVIKKVDVKWDDDVLNFYKKNRTVHTHSMGQVRHRVTSSGVGGWRKYAKELKPFIDLLKPELKKLKKLGSLPFPDTLNWDLDPNFEYGNPLSTSLQAEQSAHLDKRNANRYDGGANNSVANDERAPRRKRRPRNQKEEILLTPTGDVASSEMRLKPKKHNRLSKFNKRQKLGENVIVEDSDYELDGKRSKASMKRKRRAKIRKIDKYSDEFITNTKHVSQDKHYALQEVINKWKRRFVLPLTDSLRDQLPFPSEDKAISDLLVISYGFYVSRDNEKAEQFLQEALAAERDLQNNAGINLVMTQVLLSSQKYQECVSYARKLTELEPRFTDGYLALSSGLGNIGRHQDAVDALSEGLLISPIDPTLLVQRGFNYFKMKKYKSAHADFSAVKLDKNNEAYILSLLGKCEKEFGDSQTSIKTLMRSLSLDKNQADVHLDMAIVLMEVGRVQEALEYVNNSLQIDPTLRNSWGYAGLLYQTLGECKKAIYYLGKTLEIDPYDHTSLLLSAMCYQAEVDFASSFKLFDRLMNLKGEHSFEANVPFHREIAFYRMNLLDTPLMEYNFDTVVDKEMKVGLNKRERYLFPSNYNTTIGIVARQRAAKEAANRLQPSEKAQAALDLTTQLRGWIQLNSPGFLPHRRQHRMFGLCVLEMTQQLRQHVKAVRSGEPGLWVSDLRSSIVRVVKGGMVRPTDVRKQGFHLFSYRDFFDTAVKWRQMADPFDIVFWLDGYPPKTQVEMVALSTSLYSGLKRNTRYYPYFNMTFEVFRREMRTKYFAGVEPTFTRREQLSEIERARTLGDLFDITEIPSIMFVVTECESIVSPGRTIPGTRVVVSKVPPEGFDLSIGSPTEENRFEFFSAEVDAAFEKILSALIRGAEIETIIDLTLDLYFYWANWGPLSRGTAATGYAAIIAILLAVEEHVTSKIPKLKQMDWEAILRTSPRDFRQAVRSWLNGRERTSIPLEWLDGAPGYRVTGDVFHTSRDVVSALSALDKDDKF